ncbi:MAG: pyruvate, water dikinase regulatory protein [Bacillota bacterium]|nr:pyruvate, water dikinase regulatory protein [Bacillota bacterium]MDI7248881.1 pyruvate, water dikinase regulatory protein [Bacillota bacterium]
MDAGESARTLVFVVSDSLGETAELVARAAAIQFDSHRMEFVRVPYVEDARVLAGVFEHARTRPSLLVYTLVRPDLRQLVEQESRRLGIPAVDVLGPLLEAMEKVAGFPPRLQPRLIRQLDEAYFRRIEAVEFAVKYDDGRDLRGLGRADLVLLGVSRTSKTPVSLYLAQRGYKVANVPLVPEIPLPEELLALPRGKVVGLTIAPECLCAIRSERVRTMGLNGPARYADPDRVRDELAYAREVFRRLGCPVVDVTHRAVEETANRVLEVTRPFREGEAVE